MVGKVSRAMHGAELRILRGGRKHCTGRGTYLSVSVRLGYANKDINKDIDWSPLARPAFRPKIINHVSGLTLQKGYSI